MGLKYSSRTMIIILLVAVSVIGLTACRLPASTGPEPTSPSGQGFPVAGETEQTSVGNTPSGTIPTPTGAPLPPGTNPSPVPPQNSTPVSPYPAPTNVPGAPEPTATPVVYIQPTPGGPPTSYTLAEGEYPFCIARRFDVNQNELLTLNNLTPDSFFYAGQELQIPQTGNPFDGERTLQAHPTTYQIKEGDTLNTIACYYGDVSPDMISLQNNLSTPDLPAGEVLIIP